jgi:hypothetical protein
MTEEYGHIPDAFRLSPEEINHLRTQKYELTEYARKKLRERMQLDAPQQDTIKYKDPEVKND